MSQTVGQLIKVLEKTVEDLKKEDPELEVGHILMPDGGYSGDYENTFNAVEVVKAYDFDEDPVVILMLHY